MYCSLNIRVQIFNMATQANLFKAWPVYLIYKLWTFKKHKRCFSLSPVGMCLSSVPAYILGVFKSGELAIPHLCRNVLSLSFFAPFFFFVSFDLEQLVASEPVLSSVKWEEWWSLSCRVDKQRGMIWSNSIHTQAPKCWVSADIPQIPLLAESCHLSLGHYCFPLLCLTSRILFPNTCQPPALQASK